MVNAWLAHVKNTMKLHKGKPFKVVLKLAKKTYKAVAKVPSKLAKTVKKSLSKRKKKRGSKKKSAKKRRSSRQIYSYIIDNTLAKQDTNYIYT